MSLEPVWEALGSPNHLLFHCDFLKPEIRCSDEKTQISSLRLQSLVSAWAAWALPRLAGR